jgi:hypothetical protein
MRRAQSPARRAERALSIHQPFTAPILAFARRRRPSPSHAAAPATRARCAGPCPRRSFPKLCCIASRPSSPNPPAFASATKQGRLAIKLLCSTRAGRAGARAEVPTDGRADRPTEVGPLASAGSVAPPSFNQSPPCRDRRRPPRRAGSDAAVLTVLTRSEGERARGRDRERER